MRVAIHQPEHLPWLGFFDKARQVDTLVLLDHVQFRRRYFQNRNRIYGPNGAQWLTVPVVVKGRYTQQINEVVIDTPGHPRWGEQCWRRMQHAYSRAPSFALHRSAFEKMYAARWDRLVDLNVAFIRYLLAAMAIDVTIVRSSDLRVTGHKSELIVNLCRRLGATSYMSGVSGSDYLVPGPFLEQGIDLQFQQFHHPIYRQVSERFVPCLSAVDLLFTHGRQSTNILRGVDVDVMEQVFV